MLVRGLSSVKIRAEEDNNLKRRKRNYFTCKISFLNNQPDALIFQIYSVIKLYMFRASSLPIIRSFPLYIRQW